MSDGAVRGPRHPAPALGATNRRALWLVIRRNGTVALLASAVVSGLVLGLVVPPVGNAQAVLLPLVLIQTLLSVGSLPREWERNRRHRRQALGLVALHHTVSTVPTLAVAAAVGLDTPLGAGLAAMAVVPAAAGLPAFAAVAGAQPAVVTLFSLSTYLLGLGLTPLLAWLALGDGDVVVELALALGFGLVLPTAAAIVWGPALRRIPGALRTAVVMTCMLATTTIFSTTIAAAAVGVGVVATAAACGALRVVVTAVVGACVVWRRAPRLRGAAALTTSFKNDALASGLALPVAGATGVAVAIGSMLTEVALTVLVSVLGGRTRASEGAKAG